MAASYASPYEVMANVLIVDDDDDDRLLMRSLLSAEGHELFLAANGEDGMRIYLRHPIDVVVTDIQMPKGDGIELISALKGLDPDVAIVAVSGQAPHKLQVAQLAGASMILEKPLTKERLTRAIERACNPTE
jgi:DNA-binding NtrC family response regulator